MNLTHILSFHRVAEAGSFTLAARLSGVSQPTLSAQIRTLERSIGVPLFERVGRGIELTPFGEELFEETSKLSVAIDAVAGVLRNRKDGYQAHLGVSADSAIHVVPILSELKKHTPALSFTLKTENSTKVIDRVLCEDADVGIMAKSIRDRRLFSLRIRVDQLVLVVPLRDPLAQRKTVKLTDLTGRDFIVREKGSITRELSQARLQELNIVTGQIIEIATREASNEAIACGLGVGIVFASEASHDPRLRSVELSNVDVTVSEFIICRRASTQVPIIRRFLDTALRVSLARGWLSSADVTAEFEKLR